MRRLESTRTALTESEAALASLREQQGPESEETAALRTRVAGLKEDLRREEALYDQARIDQVLDPANQLPNIMILEKATSARKVHEPRPWTLMIGLALGGLLLGIIAAVLSLLGPFRAGNERPAVALS